MFDFLIDALNGGESLQSLNRLLKTTIRNVTASEKPRNRHAPRLGAQRNRQVSTSFSFDEAHPSCELSFITVVSRILQQQMRLEARERELQGDDDAKTSGHHHSVILDEAVHKIVAFIEKSWYAVSRNLPMPLRDGGPCQQKPHQMLTWIKLIGDIAEEAIDQLSREYIYSYVGFS